MQVETKDAYEIFGFSEGEKFTFEVLKKRFKKLRFKYHPDKAGRGSQEHFLLIQNAYNLLLSTLDRQTYLDTGDLIHESQLRMKEDAETLEDRQNVEKKPPLFSHERTVTMLKSDNIRPSTQDTSSTERLAPPTDRKHYTKDQLVAIARYNRKMKQAKNEKDKELGLMTNYAQFKTATTESTSGTYAVQFQEGVVFTRDNAFGQDQYKEFDPETAETEKKEWENKMLYVEEKEECVDPSKLEIPDFTKRVPNPERQKAQEEYRKKMTDFKIGVIEQKMKDMGQSKRINI